MHSVLKSPPPPPHIESGVPMYHLKPPISGTRYPRYLGYWLPVAILLQKKTPLSRAFSGDLPKTTPQSTPFPEKMGTRMRLAYMHSSVGGGG